MNEYLFRMKGEQKNIDNVFRLLLNQIMEKDDNVSINSKVLTWILWEDVKNCKSIFTLTKKGELSLKSNIDPNEVFSHWLMERAIDNNVLRALHKVIF